MNLEDRLRPHRKALVEAAERVMSAAFEEISDLRKEAERGKSQLNHLVSVCNEAACKEEIENYLRYQATRQAVSFWGKKHSGDVAGRTLAQRTIEAVAELMGKLDDTESVAAWKLYAVFLTRAYTYRRAGGGSTVPQSGPRTGGASHGPHQQRGRS